jgi:hypothetical protein
VWVLLDMIAKMNAYLNQTLSICCIFIIRCLLRLHYNWELISSNVIILVNVFKRIFCTHNLKIGISQLLAVFYFAAETMGNCIVR